ncbi:E3 ubiquitin-protein ligase ATL4 [Heracleum sosnowskyi]|uniref:E3 ubiquitin-protein ligase ATL4 n=1 Tax=Heracleum sosnowskyi TaxID=360622 RepID=A0AAD8M651_9APIA|nr:E3 ubiquitin-protein ligase ATL4 [Heracleum sosnowskyi]
MARFLLTADILNQPPPPPPDFIFNTGGINQFTASSPPPPSSTYSSSSIVIVIIIITSAIIISASIYLILRYLSRRFHRTFSDVIIPSNNNLCTENELIIINDTLPLFTFSSVKGNIVSGDCAVCLSKFEAQDQLRLLPLCCHAFHVACIDTWLTSNQTCPLCRSTIHPTESDVLDKILNSVLNDNVGNSFRIEIGSISRRTDSISNDNRRSYSIGSFDYIVDDAGYELSRASTHRREPSEATSNVDKDSVGAPVMPPGESLAAEVASGRSSWLRDYVDRIASVSSRSIRSSGRFFSGSSRRSEPVVAVGDLESSRVGEEISELFRWLSGV